MKFFIQPSAREDIVRQYRYLLIEADSLLIAQRFLEALRQAIEQVCRQPGIGSRVTLDNPRLTGLRSWPLPGTPSIRIYYLVSGSTLLIVRVLHGKRDVASLLEKEPESD